MPSFPS